MKSGQRRSIHSLQQQRPRRVRVNNKSIVQETFYLPSGDENPGEEKVPLFIASGQGPDELEEAARQCRICLRSELSSRKRMVSPCRCGGSLRDVHLACLTVRL